MEFTKEELELLADGSHPKYVRKGLECETVIVELAKFALSEWKHYEKEYWAKHYHDQRMNEELMRRAEGW